MVITVDDLLKIYHRKYKVYAISSSTYCYKELSADDENIPHCVITTIVPVNSDMVHIYI